MRIGVDIDGVLTDLEQWQLDYGSKYCFENNLDGIQKYDKYEIREIFNWNNQKEDDFWNKYFENYCSQSSVRMFASDIIQKLKQEGNEIYIITARKDEVTESLKLDKTIRLTKEWLNKNNIYYDNIIFEADDKLTKCLENKIDIMIEDKPENIQKVATKIPVICFNAKYNKNCVGSNIIRCYSWYDIYEKINKKIQINQEKKVIKILYTNWKGETRDRNILPISIEYKSTNWHNEEQWILNALDIEKNELRGFAIKDIQKWY